MSSERNVVVLEPGYADYSTEQSILAPLSLRVQAIAIDADAVAALKPLNPIALMVRERTVGAAEINACPDLKIIVRYGVGVDNIDLNTARAHGVVVANVPDYGAKHEVSDHAVALYLAVARRIVTRDRDVRNGVWGVAQDEMIPGHRGAVLGLIGYGRIARMVGSKFRALGFGRVLSYDPHVSDEVFDADTTERCDVDSICRSAAVVSLNTPLTEETRHIIDRGRLALMKRNAVLINVSRGGLVDEAALAEALENGTLFGAGLDVFEDEPPNTSGPLFKAPNTVLTDHTAWYSEHSVKFLQEAAAKEVERVLTGQQPVNPVLPNNDGLLLSDLVSTVR